tara:strand:- start:464 stop:886 length:423 start_codon:yes stop_codon:yes gene_type:complete
MSFEQDFFSQRLVKDITVKVPLEISADGNGYTTITEDDLKEAVNYDLKSVLLTNKGERFDKNFGVGIKSYLFENIGSPKMNSLQPSIMRQISRYMPWLSQFNVQTRSNLEQQVFYVDIKYKINEANVAGHFNLSVELSGI